MLDNNTYNLIEQLAQEHKSLWRIKDEYMKDAEGHADCQTFWKKMEQDKEEHIRDLTKLVKEHLK
ncbi:hypothetical protein L0Y40_03305 [Candidatus Wolfebacteria bacterium]|nr:hypothetical protein [Candidatus Wolfebacteria bacterium]